MHRVSALLSWDRRKSAPKPLPLKRLSTSTTGPALRVKKEAFWPSTLDQECEKAARILKTFCSMAPLFSAAELYVVGSYPVRPFRGHHLRAWLTFSQPMGVSRSPTGTT